MSKQGSKRHLCDSRSTTSLSLRNTSKKSIVHANNSQNNADKSKKNTSKSKPDQPLCPTTRSTHRPKNTKTGRENVPQLIKQVSHKILPKSGQSDQSRQKKFKRTQSNSTITEQMSGSQKDQSSSNKGRTLNSGSDQNGIDPSSSNEYLEEEDPIEASL